jgi:hypothetical protein
MDAINKALALMVILWLGLAVLAIGYGQTVLTVAFSRVL